MRELNCKELELVSGAKWSFEADFGVVKWVVEGDETVQDIAGAVADVASNAYGAAVEATTDMFEWIAKGWAFSADCGRP